MSHSLYNSTGTLTSGQCLKDSVYWSMSLHQVGFGPLMCHLISSILRSHPYQVGKFVKFAYAIANFNIGLWLIMECGQYIRREMT